MDRKTILLFPMKEMTVPYRFKNEEMVNSDSKNLCKSQCQRLDEMTCEECLKQMKTFISVKEDGK